MKNIKGQKFSRLIVINFSHTTHGRYHYWLCKCECGKEKVICGSSLRRGLTKSCGCLRNERVRKSSSTHGMWGSPEYKTWARMLQRCNNPKTIRYENWGGRGIKVCKRWHKFENFYKDMGEKPTSQHSLDRINNDGNYETNNCRWATTRQQSRNTRNNKFLTFNGKTQCLTDWAKELGINQPTLSLRLKHWTIEKSLSTPVKISSNQFTKFLKV